MLDLLKEILQTLRHNKMRTALTGLSVAWGVFMLIVLLAMGSGVINAFSDNALGQAQQKIQVWGGYTSVPSHGYREGRSITLKTDDIKHIEQTNRHSVREVNSIIYMPGGTVNANGRSTSGSASGVFPSQIKQQNATIIAGRFISQKDMDEKAKVMVLPQSVAEHLFNSKDGKNAVGQRVEMGGLSYLVIGVYETRWNRSIYIPYTTARMLKGNYDDLGSITVMVQNVTSEEESRQVEENVRTTMAAVHEFEAADKSALWVWNQMADGMRGLKAMSILNISIWALGLLTLLSGIVGISNIMFVSVKERTHEIGIRRALGAKPRSILTQIIAEAVAITTLFGYIGIVMGTIVTEIIAKFITNQDIFKNPSVNLSIAIEVTMVLIVAGAIAGLFPALKALKIKPVEALMEE